MFYYKSLIKKLILPEEPATVSEVAAVVFGSPHILEHPGLVQLPQQLDGLCPVERRKRIKK